MKPNPATPDPLVPWPAVQEVWKENADVVNRFQLTPSPGGVIENSWFVMVHCGIKDPDAYDLVEALRRLERLVEERSGRDVTLMLSNMPAATNGTHT